MKKLGIYDYLLGLLILFHFVANLVWINLNKLPFPWDQAGHTIISYKFLDFFQGKDTASFIHISDYYPPFTHLMVTFFMSIFGREPNIGPFVVTIFFGLSLLFIYLYIDKIFNNKLLAFLTVFLFSLFPTTYNLSRYFLLELPLVACIFASLYFLEKTESFTNSKNVYIFSVLAGLSVMTKWGAAIYLLPFILFKLLKKRDNWLVFKSALIVFLISFIWYTANLPVILSATKITATAEISDPQSLMSWENLIYYFHQMTNFQLTWVGGLAFLFSLPLFIKKAGFKGMEILFSFMFVYIIFTLIGNKDLRYVIGLAPLISLIIAFGFINLFKKDKFFGILIFGVIIFFYIFYYFSLSFGFPVNTEKSKLRQTTFIPLFGGVDLINLSSDTSYYLAPKYSRTLWPNSLIAKELSKHNPTKKVNVLLICEKPFFNQVNMELARRQLGFDNLEFFAPYSTEVFKSEEDMVSYLNRFDLVLIADKDLGPQGGIRHIDTMKQLKFYLERYPELKINTYYLPDGDTLSVFKILQ